MLSADPATIVAAPAVPAAPDPAAATPLVVRAGGSVLVATDALLAHLPELARLADEVERDAHELALLGLDLAPGALRAEVDGCEADAFGLAAELRRLQVAVAMAEGLYEAGERASTWLHDLGAEWGTALFTRAAVFALPGVALAALAAWVIVPGSDDDKKRAMQRYLVDHPELITSPEFSGLVRRAVMSADDAALALAGAPPVLAGLLGEHGLGVIGVGTSAGALIGAGGASGGTMFAETKVKVERVSEERAHGAPAGAAERLERVPAERQVRIERYEVPGEPPRYVVYVAPTQTFSPFAEAEPWDLTSNVAGVAGLPAGSIRATELAMADAGITADDEVVLVGFSQGGLVADAVAASGRWNAVGLETYGDPGGGIELPEGIRGVAVRHSDDFVVATGGPQGPTDRTIVERRAFAEGAELPIDELAPAHQKRAYAETARMLDEARSPELRRELDALDSFARDYARREGATVTTFSYRAERVPGDG
ncbi:hypothetical protein H4J02_13690 [Protaetiibacter sp. SSC-01]|uniref:hypothetical protein n=1 Tax=Protaetiibacter sp. SSC-01 TaxID=2759943 RepID=UPI001656C89A|nr:hypothetical protein [Protaetiibacter sp. SSC-01]QNO37450.1 hypothetical protein H4J02_13690 [Protaetiibacter sp. SSC-01]